VDLNVFAQGLTWGALRDASFKMYQQNLPLAFGLAGLPLLLLALFRTRSGPASRGLPGRGFWIVFSLYTVIAGIAVHGGDDPVGLAHICLQPFILIGLAFLASRWEDWPPALRIAAAAGLLADFLLGVALHFWFQATPFLPPNPARGFWHLTRHDLLIGSPKANWDLKSAGSLIFLGDGAAPFRPALLLALAIPLLYTGYRLASTTLRIPAPEKLPPTQRKARKDPPARRSR
jgi:hypothetical protein